MYETDEKQELGIIASVGQKGGDRKLAFEYLDELESLVETAGASIIEKFYQELPKPNPKTVIGKGKVDEIKEIVDQQEVNLLIFDNELSPAQVKNLENKLKIKVLDRSALILDIFARHAKSLEAKTQVELAQLQYMLPRLSKMWTHLSKQYGGIGTKGPGETQIETDRRIVRERIQRLKEKLAEISVQKEQQRKGREAFPKFALVGYTNAGKSTLMNTLTESGVYVENKLFATLDTTVRTFELPRGRKALLSDTVGFIRKLPTHLIASFHSTLAEAAEADILVHLVDVSHEFFREHIKVVNETLKYLKIKDKPIILLLNKIDNVEEHEGLKMIEQEFPNCLFISAKRGINIQAMLELFQDVYDKHSNQFEFMLPFSDMGLTSKLYKIAEVISRDDTEDGIFLRVVVQPDNIDLFRNNFTQFLKQDYGN